MPKHGDTVYIDTNAIQASWNIGQWKNLVSRYTIITVDTCIEEALRHNRHGKQLIKTTPENLIDGITVLHADDAAKYTLLQRNIPDLDAGELDLLACATLDKKAWLHCGPDRAAMLALVKLDFYDRLTSLEELCRTSAKAPKVPEQYTAKWLSYVKTQMMIDEGKL